MSTSNCMKLLSKYDFFVGVILPPVIALVGIYAISKIRDVHLFSMYTGLIVVALVGAIITYRKVTSIARQCKSSKRLRIKDSNFANTKLYIYVFPCLTLFVIAFLVYNFYSRESENQSSDFRPPIVIPEDNEMNSASDSLSANQTQMRYERGNVTEMDDSDFISHVEQNALDENSATFFRNTSDSPQLMQFIKIATELLQQQNDISQLSSEQQQATMEFGPKFAQFLAQKNWGEISSLVKEYNSRIPEIETTTLQFLIQHNAPTDIIQEYIASGAQVSPPALLELVKYGEFDKVLDIENMGVELSEEILPHFSMLELSMISNLSKESFDFLIARDPPSNEYSPLGTDAIGMAIIGAQLNQDIITHMVSSLMLTGSEINSHHQYLMQGLKTDSPTTYNKLIEAFPELCEGECNQ